MVDRTSSSKRRQSAASWLVGLTGCVALGILYFITRTEVHTFDALSYTWALEDKPFGLLFHPHHLYYGPSGWLAYRAAQALGYAGRADTPVQLLNAAAGALGVFFLWRFGSRWTGRKLASMGVAAVMGLSFAYWTYAAEVEVYTFATAFLALSLWILAVLDESPRARWAIALGLAHTGAIMYHQTNVLFGLGVGVFLLSRPRLRSWRIILSYGLAVLVPVLLSYGYVAKLSQFPDWHAFYAWLTDYAQSGLWGGFLSMEHSPALRSGLQTAVSTTPWLAWSIYAAAFAAFLFGWIHTRTDDSRRSWLIFSLAWFLTYLLFFWWWEPWNIEFWIATLPLLGMWLLSVWPPATPASGEAADRSIPRPAAVLYTAVPFLFAALLFSAHYDPIRTAGDAANDYYRQVTDALAEVVGPEELVVTRGNVLDLYIPFYARHPHIISMRQLEQAKGGDRSQIMGELLGQLDWAIVTGRPFLIDQFILDEPREAISNPFGLEPAEAETLRGRYPLQPVAFRGEQPLFYGTPRYDNRGRSSWEFSDSLLGWSTWGIESPRFEQGGWCFESGVDPQLKGPAVSLQAQEYDSLLVDITIGSDESSLQLFWRTPDGDYSMENSMEAPLQRGRHQYELSLAGQAGWEGTIAQLRIDPVPGVEPGQETVTACVHAVKLYGE